jgi:hypothetical protein
MVKATQEQIRAVSIMFLLPAIDAAIKRDPTDLVALSSLDEVIVELLELAKIDYRIKALVDPLLPIHKKCHDDYIRLTKKEDE